MITSKAIRTAQQFNRLYVQVMREKRKRNPDRDKIERLKNTAARTSTRLRELMGW